MSGRHAFSPAIAADRSHESEPWVRLGMRLVVWLVGGMALLAAIVSIAAAVVAVGIVSVDGNYQTVQHPQGGIVARIHVKDGDSVRRGEVLISLDETEARASHSVSAQRVADLSIQLARLEAERDRAADFEAPAGLDSRDPQIARLIAAQRSLLAARRTARIGEQSMLAERRGQLTGEVAGLTAQLAARRKELAINAQELATVMPLYDKGYVSQQRLAPLQREQARLEGEIGRLTADIARTEGAIAEQDLRLAQLEKSVTEQVVDELRKVEAALGEERERLVSLADRLQRIEIRSPRDGRVHALAVHTIGGVVTPASPLLQIIPDDALLMVTAEIAPRDVDKVRAGLEANILFPAFNARTTPRLKGRVDKVSAAEITDGQGRKHFTAQIRIPRDELAKIGREHALVPGMPAEVFIETASRSILSYIVKPLTDALSLAFRES